VSGCVNLRVTGVTLQRNWHLSKELKEKKEQSGSCLDRKAARTQGYME
jgi:hypothetical protein